MAFFDLSLPYTEPPRSGGKEVAAAKALRLKLATKAMELGYVGIAHNRSIKGAMTEKDYCTIPLLTLGSLIKVAPRLNSSVGFHRDLLGVPRATPFRQYTRLTLHVDSIAQCNCLNSGNPVLKSYDIVAVRPLNQSTFDHVCENQNSEVDIISIDFADETLFRLNYAKVKAAIKKGIYFEIKYYDLLKDAKARRQVITNAKLLVDWTKGKNLIISSGAPSVAELRGPNDVINLMFLIGLSSERARAAISKNCRNMIAKVLKKKRFHKEAVRVEMLSSSVEMLSSSETFSLEQPLSGDCLKWDPLSSGEGDMLLDDLAKAFDATNKSAKAIDFTSVLGGLPSHGFRVKDIKGTEPLTQPPASKLIDAPVHYSNQVLDIRMADSASSDDHLREDKTIGQIKMQIPATIVPLRKCSTTSQGQGNLVQNQAAASLTLIRCTKSDVASDVNMQTELGSGDKSLSPSKSDHGIPVCPVENLNMETIVVGEVVVEGDSKEGSISGNANDGNYASIDDEMKIDSSSEANHDECMEVTVEDRKHETGDSNINLPNLSSETTDLLRESDKSLSPEAVGQDQVSRLESNEAELGEGSSDPYHNTLEITVEDKNQGETETETNHRAHVQSSERNNATNLGKARSRVRLPKFQPFKPFLLQSRFKRINKRRKHRRAA